MQQVKYFRKKISIQEVDGVEFERVFEKNQTRDDAGVPGENPTLNPPAFIVGGCGEFPVPGLA